MSYRRYPYHVEIRGPQGHPHIPAAVPPSNSSLPIALLPNDVLLDIFYMAVVNSWGCRRALPWPMPEETAPIVLSHICSYWRQLTLASPRLWSFIFLTERSSSLMLEAYLERSKNTPLHVMFEGVGSVLNVPGDLGRNAVILAAHTDRLVAFYALHLQPREMTAVLLPFVEPAPQLRRLRLQTDRQLLSPSVFARQMPALRDISLKGISMAWLPYKDLNSLMVEDQLVPSMDRLLWTLRSCPRIKTLKLGLLGAISHEGADNHSRSQSIIELSHLKELSLHSHVHSDVVDILAQISFPPSTAVELKFFGARRTPIDIARHCPSLRAITSQVKSLLLELVGAYAWSASVDLSSADTKLRLHWEWFEEGLHSSILDFIAFSAISFPAVNHLAITANSYRLHDVRWRQLLTSVPTVASIELDIRDSMVLAFFSALAEESATQEMSTALACPNLMRFAVTRIDEQESILEKMATCFEGRALRGNHLQSFEIVMRSGGNFPPAVYTRLDASIDTVTIKYVSGFTDLQPWSRRSAVTLG